VKRAWGPASAVSQGLTATDTGTLLNVRSEKLQMEIAHHKPEAVRAVRARKLLIVGPLPPPIGGSPLTVQEIVQELSRNRSVQPVVINTSPSGDVRKRMTGLRPEKFLRMASILPRYFWEIRRSDASLVFANNLFAFTAVPVMLLLARILRKAIYIKPVGGDIDVYMEARQKPLRRYLLAVLRSANGVLAQTRLLQEALIEAGCRNTHYIPGFRSQSETSLVKDKDPGALRLIFLAHITRAKGSLVLLEALRRLDRRSAIDVHCDFFGPIHDEIREEFLRGLQGTPNAHYRGVAEAGIGPSLIANYDALVLPSFFECEGHPGVLIEAMHAGVPVITTKHRAIPELVTHGENGLLVPTHDSEALADAIGLFASNRPLMEQMGLVNSSRGQEFRADVVISKMLKIIFPP
jgi:glycosyltransferase involved in cell wall biosynthesis